MNKLSNIATVTRKIQKSNSFLYYLAVYNCMVGTCTVQTIKQF